MTDGRFSINDLVIGDDETQSNQSTTSKVLREMQVLWKIAWPLSLGTFCMFSWAVIPMIWIGKNYGDQLDLAAAGVGFMYVNLTGRSILQGICVGVIPLASRASLQDDYPQVGDLLRKCLLILFSFSIIVAILWIFSYDIISNVFGQSDQVAYQASKFMDFRLIGLVFFSLFLVTRMLLRISVHMKSILYINIGISLINIFSSWFWIHYFGFVGAAISVSTCDFLGFVFSAITAYKLKVIQRCWGDGWSKSSFQGWWIIIKSSLPGTMILCCEWWGNEIMTVISGLLGLTQLASQPLLAFTTAIFFCFSVGQGIAVGMRLGSLLALKQPDKARITVFASFLSTCSTGIICSTFLYFLKSFWGHIWTSDVDIRETIQSSLPFVCVYILFEAINSTASNVLQAVGRTYFSAIVNFITSYLIAIPIAVVLSFPTVFGTKILAFPLFLEGVWIGRVIGAALQCFVLYVVVLNLDYHEEAVDVLNKMQPKKKTSYDDETQRLIVEDEDDDEFVDNVE